MNPIKLSNWNRKDHFLFFNKFDNPHLSLSDYIDISKTYHFCKKEGHSIFQALMFLVTKVTQDIPEFRYRIINGEVVDFPVIHPRFTLKTEDNLYDFCQVEFHPKGSSFLTNVKSAILGLQKNQGRQVNHSHGQDVIFISCTPWLSFSNISHPTHKGEGNSIPIFTLGKFQKEKRKVKVPFNIHAHHALIDGHHIGLFFDKLQKALNQPELYFEKKKRTNKFSNILTNTTQFFDSVFKA